MEALLFLGNHAEDFLQVTMFFFVIAIVCVALAMKATPSNGSKSSIGLFADIFIGVFDIMTGLARDFLVITIVCYVINYFIN